jgi:hypothetical protein
MIDLTMDCANAKRLAEFCVTQQLAQQLAQPPSPSPSSDR